MPEEVTRTAERVRGLLSPGVRGNLIPKGLARSVIWRTGVLPDASPNYSQTLSGDLLEYGYTLLRFSLLLNEGGESNLARAGFERAAEAIESVVRNGDSSDPERGFHHVVAACAYHLAHFSARSYSLVPSPDNLNLAPPERGLVYLLRRSLSTLRAQTEQWLTDAEHSDDLLAERLQSEDDDFSVDELLRDGVTENFLRALALFDFALLTGHNATAESAVALLEECETAASDFNMVTIWWVSKLAKNLVSDLWSQSLHRQLPPEVPGDAQADWRSLRARFIGLLQSKPGAEIDLWPSQLEAARRAVDEADDLVVSLPTSAGKTRIAELCILRALASKKRVVYVTPLRALSAQVERDLEEIFRPLGKAVSSLYGASGEVGLDSDTLANRDVVVATPEKLDFALRQAPSLLDDVGLIVLDEAHTIGPGEREVRYEVLVQRLLRRSDATTRRTVCLSAILPKGEQLSDFVSWIRQDEPGEAVVADWRPTRQRFGTITWRGDHARLDLGVENERTFIPRFITGIKPPKARKKLFPSDPAQLTLASAWRITNDGRSALIFCPQRNSVESLARKVSELHAKGLLTTLVSATPALDRAQRIGAEWLGTTHPAVSCLAVGVAVHHAGLPKAFLREVEGLLRSRQVSIVICSPTLAQGLNLSASALLMYSLRRGKEIISGQDFGNVIGRAGRARVDIDGQILYVLYAPTSRRLQEWDRLQKAARERSIRSGLFTLIALIMGRLQAAYRLDGEALLEYTANHTGVWGKVFGDDNAGEDGPPPAELLASLDSAILALVERLDCDSTELPVLFDEILRDSLWAKTLSRRSATEKAVQQALLEKRAQFIWANSTPLQRKGYFAAGVSFNSGRQLDEVAVQLNALLFAAEMAIDSGDAGDAIASAVQFAEIVLQIRPFAPREELPMGWQVVLGEWMDGHPMAEVVASDPERLVDFIEDVVVYRLVWAAEAVRVRSNAHQDEYADVWSGKLAEALEVGTLDRSAVILIHAGLGSRVAALRALSDFPASFGGFDEMREWVRSDAVARASKRADWPTPETADLWRAFVNSLDDKAIREWRIQTKAFPIRWHSHEQIRMSAGGLVRVLNRPETKMTRVYTPDFTPLGELSSRITALERGIAFASVSAGGGSVEVTYIGPDELK